MLPATDGKPNIAATPAAASFEPVAVVPRWRHAAADRYRSTEQLAVLPMSTMLYSCFKDFPEMKRVCRPTSVLHARAGSR